MIHLLPRRMSSGGGGGGAGERAWPELAKSMSDLQIQLSNGDIKCANCDEPATKATDKLKFYCAEHIAIQFKGFSTDDVGDDVWEFEELGYFSWADKDVLEKKGRQDIIKFIEEHEEFGEWHDKCPGCLSSVENCQKECAECVEWSGDEDDEEDGIHGDERLDQWVRDSYGEEFDWVFLDCKDGYEVVEELPKFVVLDDSGDKKTGIAIVKKDE